MPGPNSPFAIPRILVGHDLEQAIVELTSESSLEQRAVLEQDRQVFGPSSLSPRVDKPRLGSAADATLHLDTTRADASETLPERGSLGLGLAQIMMSTHDSGKDASHHGADETLRKVDAAEDAGREGALGFGTKRREKRGEAAAGRVRSGEESVGKRVVEGGKEKETRKEKQEREEREEKDTSAKRREDVTDSEEEAKREEKRETDAVSERERLRGAERSSTSSETQAARSGREGRRGASERLDEGARDRHVTVKSTHPAALPTSTGIPAPAPAPALASTSAPAPAPAPAPQAPLSKDTGPPSARVVSGFRKWIGGGK
eukprot:2234556-Rhodomonas_salina.1